MAFAGGYGIGIRVTIPPWPVRLPNSEDYGEPVLGIDDHHSFLCDVYREGDGYYTAGGDGVLLKLTARHPNLSLARRKAYRLADAIRVGSKQYRTDIGDRVNDDEARLRAWGWLS